MFLGDFGEFSAGFAPEWATGGGEDEFFDLVWAVALEALEEGGMFAIDGGESDAFSFDQRHDNLSGSDEDFFAGKGDIFSGVDSGDGGLEADDSRNGYNDEIGFGEGCDIDNCL